MSHPVNESLIFLSIARNTLSDAISLSDKVNESKLVNFITNEASDYQIMSLLVDGTCPDEKFNSVEESKIWDKFSKSVMYEFKDLSKSIDPKSLETVVFEMGPVSSFGYSSAAPIMEFQMDQGFLTNKSLSEINMASLKAAAASGKKWAINKLARVGGATKGAVAGAKGGYGVAGAKGAVAGAKMGAAQGSLAAGAAGGATKAAMVKTGALASTGALAVAALTAYAAYQVYKRFMSKAAKACKGKSGKEKTACMKQYRMKAIQFQIAELSKGSSKCKTSKDPAKCQAAIKAKVDKLKGKLKV